MKKLRIILGLVLVIALLLSGCERLPFEIPWLAEDSPTETPAPELNGGLTPTPQTTSTIEETLEPITRLTVWVPPEMDPSSETASSLLFASQLALFSEMNDGIEIDVRVKAVSGEGNLLDSLRATSAAAPDVLPDLIALPRPDLESAALKGLIFPLEGLTEIPDDPDWFPFARDMALLQGSTFGLPFAADSLVLVYRPINIPEFPGTWAGLMEQEIPLTFPAGSDKALFTMALYQAVGGAIQDNQRRPMLEVEPLAEVFRLFHEGVGSGTFAETLEEYQTDSQVWTAFIEEETDMVVTWASNFLKEGPADAVLSPLFPISDSTVSIGTGWSWAVATPQEHRQQEAVALAEFLVQSEYLQGWTESAGYLPPRPSALEGWQNRSVRTVLSQIAVTTRLQPSNDVMVSLGQILREGTLQILQNLVEPARAAQLAVESLEPQ